VGAEGALDGNDEFFDVGGWEMRGDHAALGEEVEFDARDAVDEVPGCAVRGVVFFDLEAFP